MEQEELYKNADPLAVRRTPVKAYHCPSRRAVEAINGLAKIDYAGNAGDQPEGTNGLVMRTTQGVVRMSDVSDGLSSTVMVAEKQMNQAMFGQTLDDAESYCTSGWSGDWGVYRWGTSPPGPDFNMPDSVDPSQAFGSAHTAGFYCVFADGSVRFIRYSVNPITWRRACVRDDNQNLNPDNL
jgi:hypothetical protein